VRVSSGSLRLFFALQPGAAQNVRLVDFTAPWITQLGAQPVPAQNLHITLCFVGSVPADRLPELRGLAGRMRGSRATLRFDNLEYWRKPRVLCATAPETAAALPAQSLSKGLAEACTAAGFLPDLKPFRAHVTLARKLQPARAASLKWPSAIAPPISVSCDRFMLMRSDRGENGSIYSVVESWPLDGDKSR